MITGCSGKVKNKKPSGSLWAALGSLRGSFAETLGGNNIGQDGAKSEDESRWSQQSSAVSLSVFALSPGGGTAQKKSICKTTDQPLSRASLGPNYL